MQFSCKAASDVVFLRSGADPRVANNAPAKPQAALPHQLALLQTGRSQSITTEHLELPRNRAETQWTGGRIDLFRLIPLAIFAVKY